jgi:SAM-dependent methyltransferase
MESEKDPFNPSAEEAIRASRRIWESSAALHRESTLWRQLIAGFRTPGYSCLDEHLTRALTTIGVSGKAVAQPCCNNGRELISLKNMGAARVVGFDQAEAFLEQARHLAAIAKQTCEFVEGDVHTTLGSYAGQFDLVLITIGVFGWMPDLNRFMAEVIALLRPEGQLLIYEEHPVANMFEPGSHTPLNVEYSYFRQHPFVSNEAVVYDATSAPPVADHYWFVHPLSKIFMAMIAHGITIKSFEEFGKNISSRLYDALETQDQKLPLSYIVRGTRGQR